MKIPDDIKKSVNGTIGFAEAANKHSFTIGAQVAFNKAEEYFNKEIASLKGELAYCKQQNQVITTDIRTIVAIFSKYQDVD